MEAFYVTVLTIATIILIIILIVFGVLLSTGSHSQIYPANPSQCPDYWLSDGSNCVIPRAGTPTGKSINVGDNSFTSNDDGKTYGLSSDSNSINFNDPSWGKYSESAICAQQKWANYRGILWDGVSNYNSCKVTSV